MRAELVMIRAKNDLNCYKSAAGVDGTDVDFTITKVSWEVPNITLGDESKLNLMNELRANPSVVLSFRQWEFHELPALNHAKNQVWRIKNSNELEKPRWILVALQKDNMNSRVTDPTSFTHSNVTDMRVYLNSQVFPYQRMNLDFDHDDYGRAFLNYRRFRENYYGKESNKCLFNYSEFKSCPIFVIDCSRQQESIKDSTVDIRLEIESSKNFGADTKAYCLILHDNMMEYDPFTEEVTLYIHHTTF